MKNNVNIKIFDICNMRIYNISKVLIGNLKNFSCQIQLRQ